MKNKQGIELKIGQRWENCDRRMRRQVKTIKRIDESGSRIQWAEAPCNWYAVRRLYPHSTGYRCLDADPANTGADLPLTIAIEGKQLVIRTGIDRLASAINAGSHIHGLGTVVDAAEFAEGMARTMALRYGTGDSSTLLSTFLTQIAVCTLQIEGIKK